MKGEVELNGRAGRRKRVSKLIILIHDSYMTGMKWRIKGSFQKEMEITGRKDFSGTNGMDTEFRKGIKSWILDQIFSILPSLAKSHILGRIVLYIPLSHRQTHTLTKSRCYYVLRVTSDPIFGDLIVTIEWQ